MKLHYWSQLSKIEQSALLQRPIKKDAQQFTANVSTILQQVRTGGDKALKALTWQYDQYPLDQLPLSTAVIQEVITRTSAEFKKAIAIAKKNIHRFHQAQRLNSIEVETMPGIYCQQVTRPINRVGLYIPNGSAPLFSTVLMLAIPAQIAGCRHIVLCSPPPIADEIVYAASCCHIDTLYQVGGVQAIAAMAFGSETIPKVDKLFGPGNALVTEAKRQVNQQVNGLAIDMPAGPSEVLIIADELANPAFIAADLLAQIEHGDDSQALLVTSSQKLALAVQQQVKQQLSTLTRQHIVHQSLKHSRCIITDNLMQCIDISNDYAPEHLIIHTQQPEMLVEQITNAGSVFLGAWSAESIGDYASGTNHVLPTDGYAKSYSSLGLADFQKRMTIQRVTKQGLLAIAPTVEQLAGAEKLTAHQQAVTLRIKALAEASLCQ